MVRHEAYKAFREIGKWYADSANSNYITNDLKEMTDLEELDLLRRVRVGDDYVVLATYKEKIILKLNV